MTRSLARIQRPFPEGDHPPAARRLVELPLLGRRQDHLRGLRQGRAPARHRRQRVHRLPAGLRPLHPRLCRRHGWMRPRARAWRSAASSRSAPSVNMPWRTASPRMVPAAELVRFSNSGTEAVMAALRLARAHTGRDSYVVIEGGYHGVFDAALWTTQVEDWRPSSGDPHLVPYSAGVPTVLRALMHAVPMNDADRLESVFKAYGHQIAAFLIEPIMGNCCSISATREFVHAARALCDKYGIVMIIDEVKTGFRVARGGCQELFNVQGRPVHFRQGRGQRLPDLGARRPRGHHAPARQGRRAWRYVHRAFGCARRRREDAWRSSRRHRRCRRSRNTARSCAPASARSFRSAASATPSAGIPR